MRRHLTLLAGFFTLLGVAACTVSFEDTPTTPGTFKCENNEDCIGPNQVCEKNGNGTKVCREDSGDETTCVDKDGDGWGSEGDLSVCAACQSPEEYGCVDTNGDGNLEECCANDCDDNNKDIHPGQLEQCDQTDHNCDDSAGAPIDQAGCSQESVGCRLAAEAPQSDTDWGCAEINGTSQCVLKGDYTTDAECRQPSAFGKCVNGEWTEVPKKCTEL